LSWSKSVEDDQSERECERKLSLRRNIRLFHLGEFPQGFHRIRAYRRLGPERECACALRFGLPLGVNSGDVILHGVKISRQFEKIVHRSLGIAGEEVEGVIPLAEGYASFFAVHGDVIVAALGKQHTASSALEAIIARAAIDHGAGG